MGDSLSLEKRDRRLGVIATYSGGATARLIDSSGRVLRRVAVGEAATVGEVRQALDYLIATASFERRRRPSFG